MGSSCPADFIPLAEERGLIGAIDAFVLDEACRQLAQWVGDGEYPAGFTVSVNLSGQQLSDPALVERVASVDRRPRHCPLPALPGGHRDRPHR